MSRTRNNRPFRLTARCSGALAALLACATLSALPEDASQPIVVESGSSELFLDDGLIIHRGSVENPARITQGSRMIAGTEIRIERGSDGSLRKVTAVGSPARYQEQQAADQEPIQARGLTLIFDNTSQILTLSEAAEFIQAGNTLSGHRIEYDMTARRANATSSSSENQVKMVIPAAPTGD